MTTVFIGGSRRITRLPATVEQRLAAILDQQFAVLVGDANGADKAVQRYFAKRGYRKVTVFCMRGDCRNNLGDWPTRAVEPPNGSRRDFEYFSTKDRVMAEEATHGLMLWDGDSKGTLNNIVNLVRRQKPAVVYLEPARKFVTAKSAADVGDLLRWCAPETVARLERELPGLHVLQAPPLLP